ncbi:hypothetical protein D1013_16805 [Euzebyella marina]|uniref:Peptidase M48 domain-containing protein n=1 Tax=Euzebyella marina TaxID=1761453 RepID=A0A3G2L9I9_9FLAO|nr:hypothetical protein [Euzebyella marina]AYN68919.1 hypothetical protein D1013_16805 [Euzebyella marina]
MTLISLNAQHQAPKSIKAEAEKALSYYPELNQTSVNFKFKPNIPKSTMRAQPTFWSLFRSRKKRKYVVLISKRVKISDRIFLTEDIPEEIMVGWLGHELGHIMDYKNRSSWNLIWFGIKYSFSGAYIREAERAADTYAVSHGMADYILKTKSFILDNAEIEESYKERIRKYYLSPKEILKLVNEKEEAERKEE